jgi:outer membrane biosynthesis protein TonB
MFTVPMGEQVSETETWAKWESQTVNGVFPLRRFLGKSSHSVVFLTEYAAGNVAEAAIKLIPENPALTESQLSQWRRVAAMPHPHLIRLFDSGHCEIGGHPFFFVVMELAEQTLAQILPHRALTPEETRGLLLPTLDALGFLHAKGLAQGQLKPSNILVVSDQIKLASDTIRTAGGENGAPGDIFSLGLTLAEALTQQPPSWLDAESVLASLPADLSKDLIGIIQRCVNRNPAKRPTVADLQAKPNPTPTEAPSPSEAPGPGEPPTPRQASAPSEAQTPSEAPALPETVADESAASAQRWSGTSSWVGERRPAVFVATTSVMVLLFVIAVIFAGAHFLRGSQGAAPQPALPVAEAQGSADTTDVNPAPSPPSLVVHQEIPDVSQTARQSIQGTIKVSVRVTVDASGNVVAEAFENRGPSNYFARVANDAAKRWTFVPVENQDPRRLLLEFAFTRAGTTARVVGHRS